MTERNGKYEKVVRGGRYGEERALYGLTNALVENCLFEGEEDGESAMKECRGVDVENCRFSLRYPLWHINDLIMSNTELTPTCRAALWYDDGVSIKSSLLNGIKAVRECKKVDVTACKIDSAEFGWQSEKISLSDTEINSEYAFLHTSDITLNKVSLTGKYTFQYTKNVTIKNSKLNTKDAFWHAENVLVEDSDVIGEYLGWYSKNLTLVRCRIKGTQPLCYCENLKLVDCTMEETDLSFEYSDVEAKVKGFIMSVKNPRSGHIEADEIGEVVITDDAVFAPKATVKTHGGI